MKPRRVPAALCLLGLVLLLCWPHSPARATGTDSHVLFMPLAARSLKNPNLAATPPMGWSSWNKFGCNISEGLIESIADALVSSGMRDAGYRYVNVDDCWQSGRDERGTILADPQRFPSGMRALGDYLHARGLKFGIYSDRGTLTCAGRPGSYGYEYQDARTYAGWGVDYLKYDNCYAVGDQQADYERMRDALAASGREIVFGICAWEFQSWMPDTGQLWRTSGDIADDWATMTGIVDVNAELAAHAGPGGWNDPDMLEVGNGRMTDAQYRAHFSLWAVMAAPLIAGNDVRRMSAGTRAILLNDEVIAVDQDPLGRQGMKVRDDGDQEIFAKELDGGAARAVVLLNRGGAPAEMTVTWSEIGLPPGSAASARDLWSHADLGGLLGGYAVSVPAQSVVMLKVVAGATP